MSKKELFGKALEAYFEDIEGAEFLPQQPNARLSTVGRSVVVLRNVNGILGRYKWNGAAMESRGCGRI